MLSGVSFNSTIRTYLVCSWAWNLMNFALLTIWFKFKKFKALGCKQRYGGVLMESLLYPLLLSSLWPSCSVFLFFCLKRAEQRKFDMHKKGKSNAIDRTKKRISSINKYTHTYETWIPPAFRRPSAMCIECKTKPSINNIDAMR